MQTFIRKEGCAEEATRVRVKDTVVSAQLRGQASGLCPKVQHPYVGHDMQPTLTLTWRHRICCRRPAAAAAMVVAPWMKTMMRQ